MVLDIEQERMIKQVWAREQGGENCENPPWWMMPFSSRAWPRWTPSSGLPVSSISISQDTNSLGTDKTQRWHNDTHFHSGVTQQTYTKIPWDYTDHPIEENVCDDWREEKGESFPLIIWKYEKPILVAFAIIPERLSTNNIYFKLMWLWQQPLSWPKGIIYLLLGATSVR